MIRAEALKKAELMLTQAEQQLMAAHSGPLQQARAESFVRVADGFTKLAQELREGKA